MTASSAAAYLALSGLLGVLAAVQDNARLLEWMPDTLSPFVLAIVPTLVTFAAGWKPKHTRALRTASNRPEG
ncbi:holin [Streptomyces halobius]|uniref:Holin n=1 Tax=Streptomyces halobius TaxID=2879846 RepID=A0ABY4M793_9ACTN|nr:holin [Streptomyces halobius]UQA92126.1 holin [Streptomyces halobius]